MILIPYKSILVMGGAGFVGSNLALLFKKTYPQIKVQVFDNLSRRGSELNISRLRNGGIDFLHGDIRNIEDFQKIAAFDLMIECSAEPSVLAGYGESPAYLLNTNLMGAINCFELARIKKADIVFLSTSRVYPYETINGINVTEDETRFSWSGKSKAEDLEGLKGISEAFPLNGVRSMYGASKLSAELILQEYINMYQMKGIINRCGVVAGPWQFGKVDQGVFTLWVLAHYFKKGLSYIGYGGEGKQVRDLLHIADLFELLKIQLLHLGDHNGHIFNVGGGLECSLSLLETTKLCEEIVGDAIKIESIPENRPADLRIYITDNSKVNETFGWKPKKTPRDIIQDIYLWVKENQSALEKLHQ